MPARSMYPTVPFDKGEVVGNRWRILHAVAQLVAKVLSSVPPSTITLWPLASRLAPSSSVRLSPSSIVRSSCKVTLPYTVPRCRQNDAAAGSFTVALNLYSGAGVRTDSAVAAAGFHNGVAADGQAGRPGVGNPVAKLKFDARSKADTSCGQVAAIHRQRG